MPACNDAITELLWFLTMDQGQDEEVGETEIFGLYCLFRGPLDADVIDHHNEIVLNLERQQEEGYREHLMQAAEIWDAMSAAGFIVLQDSSGAIYSDVYTTSADLEREWGEILGKYSLESCPECEAEAEEYGIGNPVIHEDDCSIKAEEEAA